MTDPGGGGPRPAINDPVLLRDHADREYRSRIEDLANNLLVVAQPHDLPAGESFDPGTDLSVAWVGSTGGGVMVLPARILAAHTEGTLRLWSLAVTGPASALQRRRFVRVPAAGRVVLRPTAGTQGEPVVGDLVEASEAAIRCTVIAGASDDLLAGGNQVVAEFRFGAADFAVPGRIEFLRPTTHPAELEQLVVVFDEPAAAADELRKQVFAQQLRTLRTRSESGSEN